MANYGHPEGESMKVGFDGSIKLEFHGARLSSNGGLLAYRDLDHAFGLFNSVSTVFVNKRTGRNIQHAIPTLLRQSVYSRLAGYEDINDAERLSVDPVMRAITGEKSIDVSKYGYFSIYHICELQNVTVNMPKTIDKEN